MYRMLLSDRRGSVIQAVLLAVYSTIPDFEHPAEASMMGKRSERNKWVNGSLSDRQEAIDNAIYAAGFRRALARFF